MNTAARVAYETPIGWVRRVDTGHYEVYRVEGTHSRRVGTYHFRSDDDHAFRRAMERCDSLSPAFTIQEPQA